jgi:cellulose biosynthesis protein BcsQ
MNTIIAIWNSGGKGKSSTVLALANLLLRKYPNHIVIYASKDISNLSIDFTLIIKINEKTIALESQGDPGTGLEKRLDKIVNDYDPNLIFCTCRTRGETVYAIDKTANNFGYDTIWTSTYQVSNNDDSANQIKAEHLLDLILQLGLLI